MTDAYSTLTDVYNFLFVAAFFALIAYSLFTSIATTAAVAGDEYGYSFGVGWASFPCTLLAGAVMAYVEFKSD